MRFQPASSDVVLPLPSSYAVATAFAVETVADFLSSPSPGLEGKCPVVVVVVVVVHNAGGLLCLG